MYESSKRNEDLGQKVSRNLFNQKRASNEQPEGSTAVLNGAAVLKNDSNRSAFNFLTNGFSDTFDTKQPVRDEESSSRSSTASRAAKKRHSSFSRLKDDSPPISRSSGENDSLDKSVSSNNSDALPGDASADLNGSTGKHLSRKLVNMSTKRSTRSGLPKKSKKRLLQDREVGKAEIRALIGEFKLRESIKKEKRRRSIRESMQFDVE
jgi:hypothetical protein